MTLCSFQQRKVEWCCLLSHSSPLFIMLQFAGCIKKKKHSQSSTQSKGCKQEIQQNHIMKKSHKMRDFKKAKANGTALKTYLKNHNCQHNRGLFSPNTFQDSKSPNSVLWLQLIAAMWNSGSQHGAHRCCWTPIYGWVNLPMINFPYFHISLL